MEQYNNNSLTEKTSDYKTNLTKKKKTKDISSNDIVVNFKFDDYEPVTNKYQPVYKKHHGKIYYDNVDILDQSRFKFVLNMNLEGAKVDPDSIHKATTYTNPNILSYSNSQSTNNYSKYSNNINSNINWEDIITVIYYSVDIYTCSICIEKKLICPVITRCGHIFCWPCILNYHDYWTNTSANKKVPKCPLCAEKVNLYQLKFCEILHCVNYITSLDTNFNNSGHEKNYNPHIYYSSYHTNNITFNLIMKNKKAPTLYNIYHDPDLEYYKKNHDHKEAFNFIPLENQEKFSFSRLFITNLELTLKRYAELKKQLEESLRDELSGYSDERRVHSLNTSLEIITEKINVIKKKIEIGSEEGGEDATIENNLGYNLSGSNSNSNNPNSENFSTVEDDLKNEKNSDIILSNYHYFYQEQYGDIFFLHPVCNSILLYEYGTEDNLPTEISGKILEIEMHQISPFLKNKYPFLNHLKIGSLFFFVEIEMKNNVSNHSMKKFYNVLKDRTKVRNTIKREEEHYDNYVNNIKSKEEKKLSSELVYSTPKVNVKDAFKDDDCPLLVEEVIDEPPSNEVPANEKKENKLKSLLDKTESELDREKEIKKQKNKFLFSKNDFPDLSNNDSNIKTKITQIRKASEEDEHYEEENPEKYNNLIDEDGFVMVKSKKNKGGGGNNKKKKKFAEINFNIIKEIENKQLEQPETEENKEENELKKNLAKSKSGNAPKGNNKVSKKKI